LPPPGASQHGFGGTVFDHGYVLEQLDGAGGARAEYRAVGTRPGVLYAEALDGPTA